MKRLIGFFLLLAVLVGVQTLADAQQPPPSPSEAYIVGAWRIDSFTLNEPDGTSLSSGSLNPDEWSGTMTFRKNGRCEGVIRSDDDGSRGAIRWSSDDHVRAEGSYAFTLGTFDGNACGSSLTFSGADCSAVAFGEWDGNDGNPDHGAGGGTDPTTGDAHVVHGLAATLDAGNGTTLYVVMRQSAH